MGSLFPLTYTLTSGLHNAFEDDDDLKLFTHEGALREVKEGAFGVDLMADCEWRHQEELICAGPKAHIQLTLVQGEELTFWSLSRLRNI